MGPLVADSIFLAANPYSSQIRSIGSEGPLPFFEKKSWAMHCQDSNVGRDVHGACASGYWPLAVLSHSTPQSKGALERFQTRQWANLRTPRS